MSHIKCNANNCINNQSSYCISANIRISGRDSYGCSSTQCDSFLEFKKADATYNTEFGDMPSFSGGSLVSCNAVNCLNNNDDKCIKDVVDISGKVANKASETSCESFDLKL